jgi:hypothetical protein
MADSQGRSACPRTRGPRAAQDTSGMAASVDAKGHPYRCSGDGALPGGCVRPCSPRRAAGRAHPWWIAVPRATWGSREGTWRTKASPSRFGPMGRVWESTCRIVWAAPPVTAGPAGLSILRSPIGWPAQRRGIH